MTHSASKRSTSTRLRTIAAGSVLGLTAGSAAVLVAPSPASAVPVSFDCSVLGGEPQPFTVDLTSNAPDRLTTGSTVAPVVTTALTVPEGVAGLMRLLGDEASGTITSTVAVDGVEQTFPLTVPRTDIGDSGPAVLTATGTMESITGGNPGDVIEVQVGNQSVSMDLWDLESETPEVPAFSTVVPCTPSAGQDLVTDQISVVKAGSKTRATVKYKARKDTVAGAATVKSSNGIAATGKVTFVLKKGKKTVKKVTKAVRGGKAAVTFKRVRKAGRYSLVATYSGSSRVNKSADTARFRVRR
jgi:hypothetical protein